MNSRSFRNLLGAAALASVLLSQGGCAWAPPNKASASAPPVQSPRVVQRDLSGASAPRPTR
jgi:hypothetical protein